jgi:hypothetical protein
MRVAFVHVTPVCAAPARAGVQRLLVTPRWAVASRHMTPRVVAIQRYGRRPKATGPRPSPGRRVSGFKARSGCACSGLELSKYLRRRFTTFAPNSRLRCAICENHPPFYAYFLKNVPKTPENVRSTKFSVYGDNRKMPKLEVRTIAREKNVGFKS